MTQRAGTAPPLIRLLVCVGPRCDAQGGGAALLDALTAALQEDFAADIAAGRVSCVTRDCLRHCTREPVARVEPSGEVFADPSVERLLQLVAESLANSRS
jgi:NADH:ubiquinone oxidoreductase subunit E